MRAPVPAPFAEVAGDATGEPPNQTSVSAADDATRALESMTLHPGPSPEGGYFENGDNTKGGEEHPSNGVPSFENPYANDYDHGGVAYDAYGYQLPGYQVGAGGGYDGHELQNSGGYDGYDSQGAYSQGQGAYPAQGSTYPNTVHQSLYRGHPGNQLAMQQQSTVRTDGRTPERELDRAVKLESQRARFRFTRRVRRQIPAPHVTGAKPRAGEFLRTWRRYSGGRFCP